MWNLVWNYTLQEQNHLDGNMKFHAISEITTCILNEGTADISILDSKTMVCNISDEINIGDAVISDTNKDGKYAINGVLVVRPARAYEFDKISGKVVSEPKWVKLPPKTEHNWMECCKNSWYRIAKVLLTENLIIEGD